MLSRRTIIFFLPLLVIIILFGWFYSQLRYGRDPSLVPSVLIGKPIPQFRLPLLHLGAETQAAINPVQELTDKDLPQGQWTLINYFASWCVPCRVEQPFLAQLARERVGRLTMLGIAYKDKPEAAKRFLDETGNPFSQVALDETGKAALEWGLYGVPETYLIDGNGIIRYKHTGPLTEEAIAKDITPLLDRQ